MKKLVEVIRVEITPGPNGKMYSISFHDYNPPTEQANPMKERLDQAKKELEKKGAPKEIVGMVEALSGLADSPQGSMMMGNFFINTGMLQLTPRQYEELKPAPGMLLDIELGVHLDS